MPGATVDVGVGEVVGAAVLVRVGDPVAVAAAALVALGDGLAVLLGVAVTVLVEVGVPVGATMLMTCSFAVSYTPALSTDQYCTECVPVPDTVNGAEYVC